MATDTFDLSSTQDLATLPDLTEEIMVETLRQRYQCDAIYTSIADILLAANPFKSLPIYGVAESERYRAAARDGAAAATVAAPHVFGMAANVYADLVNDRSRHCVIVSGESGAGKTETVKQFIRQLVFMCGSGNPQLEQKIIQVNPLLEAFGNASTVMNHNSSRFAKLITLHFDGTAMLGAKLSEFLLEKSRLVRRDEGESNFHIFYFLLTADSNDIKEYGIVNGTEYQYVPYILQLKEKKDLLETSSNTLEDVVCALDMLGFTSDDQTNLFRVLGGILNLGNVQFEEIGSNSDECKVTDASEKFLKKACELLGFDIEELKSCLTSSMQVTRGEVIYRYYSINKCIETKDALAKAIYGRVFSWLVNQINQLLAPAYLSNSSESIGLLDVFGFENLQKNSFEQACINLANEQLQYYFSQHVITIEQQEYLNEGITGWEHIEYQDNLRLIDLFLGKPIGLFAILDDWSKLPRASDMDFVDKLSETFGRLPEVRLAPGGKQPVFAINHYAGQVSYVAESWLEKNRDTLPNGFTTMLESASNGLIKSLFLASITRTGTLAIQHRRSTALRSGRSVSKRNSVNSTAARKARSNRASLAEQFRNSLQILMEFISNTEPHFIRCIKPNEFNRQQDFNSAYVSRQFKYSGVLAAVKIRKLGFPYRLLYPEFVHRYHYLANAPKSAISENKSGALAILGKTSLQDWKAGKTKVFLKYHHLEELRSLLALTNLAVIKMQKVVRGFLDRQKARRLVKMKNEFESIAANLVRCISEKSKYFYSALLQTASMRVKEKGKRIAPVITPLENHATESASQFADEDDFVECRSMQTDAAVYGTMGTKEAAIMWFQSTQVDGVQTDNGHFHEWFHGIITRGESAHMLAKEAVGSFLIRVSQSKFGYVLSFRGAVRVHHYFIEQTRSKKYLVVGERRTFKSLDALVAYYMVHKLSNNETLITTPFGQQMDECDYGELLPTERMGNSDVAHLSSEKTRSRRIQPSASIGFGVPIAAPAPSRAPAPSAPPLLPDVPTTDLPSVVPVYCAVATTDERPTLPPRNSKPRIPPTSPSASISGRSIAPLVPPRFSLIQEELANPGADFDADESCAVYSGKPTMFDEPDDDEAYSQISQPSPKPATKPKSSRFKLPFMKK